MSVENRRTFNDRPPAALHTLEKSSRGNHEEPIIFHRSASERERIKGSVSRKWKSSLGGKKWITYNRHERFVSKYTNIDSRLYVIVKPSRSDNFFSFNWFNLTSKEIVLGLQREREIIIKRYDVFKIPSKRLLCCFNTLLENRNIIQYILNLFNYYRKKMFLQKDWETLPWNEIKSNFITLKILSILS